LYLFVVTIYSAFLLSGVFNKIQFSSVQFSYLWPAQLYGTDQQQFMKLTACVRLSASSKLICLLYVLMTDCLFYKLL